VSGLSRSTVVGSVVSHGTDEPVNSGLISSADESTPEGTQRADGKRRSEIKRIERWDNLANRDIQSVVPDRKSWCRRFDSISFHSGLGSVESEREAT
jgi:hypothetical protein